ncbi:Type II/IV secretion system ATP hydrolase TadA/VirB11/CpaF TadA subfamily [Paramagnetospirillum magnetotacticum MS-1]|uniref:Type II/IV secretion system ATP hydrolase TadA/VirB11/CpaF TadA subfamily n=1 Tax=Paramagnetospirillum magnetotacticum MS-1 TaxID=272627 RepID=A0A0C2YIY7_PARME|nr:CpaF family protein [Paramagnetospirillum magnetotacticum]KIL99709.1 Type II/IV secretion system ATP hydrolase TadA/VirB11/CpaF TadA subfamily [Paramagnetospirillum magnetotacticum MS-1]
MFGRRAQPPEKTAPPPKEAAKPAAGPVSAPASPSSGRTAELDQRLSDIKIAIFNDLIDSVDPTELGKLEPAQVREEISDIVAEIISMRNLVISAAEQQVVIGDICNDVLGLGPLEPLIARDDIADIMVNGADKVYIETEGRIELTDIKFRDNAQLMNICQRIVAAVGRRVDEASPICDARLMDGSRVNVIVPPLAIDGPTLTIRKFKREKLTLEKLVEFGSVSAPAARVLQIASASRLNILISGGTGSGKTTLLNCMTRYIDQTERIVTCEDAAELQLQQPHVVRLETRPPNLEGTGAITMRDLVKNCLRMRPERIIVGEVRGPEAFDLLQAMNTGHDGSMGTIHANTPRDALSRVENMVAMGGYSLPAKAVREQISAAINLIVQASRLRDGSRKITHITEVVGMEGEVITLQDLYVFEFEGEDSRGRILGRHRPTGLRPAFWDRARYYGLERDLAEALGETHV